MENKTKKIMNEENIIGEKLKAQETVTLKIPKDPLNDTNIVVPVCINGYTYLINRGETVTVPKTVSDILSRAGYV